MPRHNPRRPDRLVRPGALRSDLVATQSDWRHRSKAPGAGPVSAHPRQSGQTDAYRRVRGGRRPVKTVLFMAARRFYPDVKAFY